ncbi:membrane integrity-associated transporter subunit PqiC [Pseudomonas sp. ADAK18]|uniref:PqiC family protein n=1 Tax=Pseudomonas sp. ADAK18 TaxID=2730848 RepID=UPI0014636ABD|nr:PqiC family protein [Pseudomonas sp. ADAK18]QJI30329.1 membrane integrity-associated transporter subunit PqiC [Pseudomonas sp. ADAK18]
MILRSIALFFLLALSACGSPPIRYYTLMPTAPEQRQVMNSPSIQFEMLDVRVPMQVDQPQIVVRKSADGLMLLESARWSAPLADEFHDAVAGQLELKLGGRNITGFTKATNTPLILVQLDIRRFDSLLGNYALVDAVWSLSKHGEGNKPFDITCASVIREPAGLTLDTLVLAHQRNIDRLANDIAQASKVWACPTL